MLRGSQSAVVKSSNCGPDMRNHALQGHSGVPGGLYTKYASTVMVENVYEGVDQRDRLWQARKGSACWGNVKHLLYCRVRPLAIQ